MLAKNSCSISILLWLVLFSAAVAGAETPGVFFIKIESNAPLQVAAPEAPISIRQLGVRIAGMPQSQVELKIYGLTADGSGSSGTQVKEILSIPAQDLKKHNLTGSGDEIVYSLSAIETDSVIELIARLADANGNSVGKVSHFTLDKAGSLQHSPSLLARAAASAPDFLRRLSHLYDSVREEADLRSIYVADVANGKPASAPKRLDLPPRMLQGLTLSPSGTVIAWITSSDSGFDLWSSPVVGFAEQRVLHSEDPLTSPFFVDEDRMMVVQRSSLLLLSRMKPKDARTVQLQSLPVSRLFQVTANKDAIDFVLEMAKGNPDLVTHYGVRISNEGKIISVNRLPDNPYYNAYAVSVEGLPIFFADTNEGNEGVKYLTLDNSVISFFSCKQPGLVTVAANGSRMAFAASNR
jgi:hypothetical protein